MKYYSENTVKGLLEQMDSHFVKYLEKLPSIEIEEPHGRCIDADEFKASIHMNHLNKFATNKDVQVLYKLLNDAPTVLEASTSPSGFCNTEGCGNSKPDMSKAQNHICPYYKGVCSLDENILCYCQHYYEICEKFLKVGKEKKK